MVKRPPQWKRICSSQGGLVICRKCDQIHILRTEEAIFSLSENGCTYVERKSLKKGNRVDIDPSSRFLLGGPGAQAFDCMMLPLKFSLVLIIMCF